MKYPILVAGAGEIFVKVAGRDDPVRIPLDDVTLTVSTDTVPVRADFQRQPTNLKIGDREARLKATITKKIDGAAFWEIFGLEQATDEVKKPKTEELTIPSSAPYELTLSPDTGYSVDWDALVVIDYDGETPTGAQYDRVSGTPTESGTYKVDEDNNKLVFSSADAGKKVLVRYLEVKSGTVWRVGSAAPKCVTVKAAFPILDEYGCPANPEDGYIAITVPRAVVTSDFSLQGTSEEERMEVEFLCLAGPAGYSVDIAVHRSSS